MQLNPEYIFVDDPFQRKGYILRHRGSCSVVNGDAMQLMRNDLHTLVSSPRYSAFRDRVIACQWLIPQTNRSASIRAVPTPHHLKRIQLELLLQCNLECAHCYCSSAPSAPKGLSTPVVMDLIDQAATMGVLYLDITGGEPLMRKDIFALIEYAQLKGIVVSIFTNATMITGVVARRLAELRLASVQTSLDAFTPTIHDQFRGRIGAHRRTINGIRILKAHGIPVSVTIMVHRKNQQELQQLTHFLTSELRVPYRLDRVIPSGRALRQQELGLSTKEFYELVRRLFPSTQPLVTRICDTASALIDKSHIEPSCGVGASYCFIKHNGDVVLCPTMTEAESPLFQAGNITKTSLVDIWMHHPTFQRFRGIQCRNIRVCPVASQCRGGCRSNAYLLHGTVDAPDELH